MPGPAQFADRSAAGPTAPSTSWTRPEPATPLVQLELTATPEPRCSPSPRPLETTSLSVPPTLPETWAQPIWGSSASSLPTGSSACRRLAPPCPARPRWDNGPIPACQRGDSGAAPARAPQHRAPAALTVRAWSSAAVRIESALSSAPEVCRRC